MRVRDIIRLLTLLCLLSCGKTAWAQGDSIVASLLTCSPSTEVYSLYGHTGLRMQNFSKGHDVVFNYGVFDFSTPHFTWKFILGQCDYQVYAYPYALFLEEYEKIEEYKRNMVALAVNSMPENRTYRYNFMTNNCTTQVRDQIERAVDGTVVYEEAQEHPTYRELLHHYTEGYDWGETGNDLLLGAACDDVTSDRAAHFLPEQMMHYMAAAQIYDSQNNRRPLVGETRVLLEERPQSHTEPFPLTPLQTGLIALAVMLLVMLLEYWTRRMFWPVDVVVMLLQGAAGVLIFLLFFFSAHPTVDSNWHIWLFNPIPLVCIPWVVARAFRDKICFYHYLNGFSLMLFLVYMPWMPQSFPVLTPLLALALLTRPVSYYLHYNRKAK